MNKIELQKNAELIVNPINVVSKLNFKLAFTQLSKKYTYDDLYGKDEDETFYSFRGESSTHRVVLYYRPDWGFNNYELSFRKNGSQKGTSKSFDTELELCVYLKQSPIKP